MVQVIVDRENQKSTVECSEVKGYVLGNGPSRAHINLNELSKDGIIYGCNALYRDFTPDYLFATDIGMIVDIFKDDYKGKCIFTDLDVTPIHFFDTIFEGIKMSLPPNIAIKIFYYGKKENATDFLYMGEEKFHVVLWIDRSGNSNFEWGFRPLTELPSTGMMALQKAAENGHKEIIMYGFDGLKNDNHRNIYDGSKYYQFDQQSHDGQRHPETYRPMDADKWSQYFKDIIDTFPDCKIELI